MHVLGEDEAERERVYQVHVQPGIYVAASNICIQCAHTICEYTIRHVHVHVYVYYMSPVFGPPCSLTRTGWGVQRVALAGEVPLTGRADTAA